MSARGQSRIDRYSTCSSAIATVPASANSESAGSLTKKASLTKQRVYKIMICRWPRWLSTPARVEKSLVLIYSYRFAWSILQSCDALSHPALSARRTKPYRSLQRTTGGTLSASTWQSFFVIANGHCLCLRRLFSMQRQFLCLFCECRLDDKESQAWLNNESLWKK